MEKPWLNNDAIKFLSKYILENPNPKILEFGSGGSTIWFSKITLSLTTIEHDKEWFNHINKNLYENKSCNPVDIRLIEQDYYKVCQDFPDNFFDIILIDGINRVNCAQASIRILKPGGILMLDNAERPWYHKIYSMLNNWKFYKTSQIRSDLSGKTSKLRETNWWIKP